MTASFFLTAILISAQPTTRAEEVVPRFEQLPLLKLYPQDTAKAALESAIKACEKGRFDYTAAFLLDPVYIDAEATKRGKIYLADVETALRLRKEREKEDSNIPRNQRIPDEPEKLMPIVEAEALKLGFQRFVSDMIEQNQADPNLLKELRRFFRDGQWEESGNMAKVTLRDVKDKAVYLKKVGSRWFVENRQIEEKPTNPMPNP